MSSRRGRCKLELSGLSDQCVHHAGRQPMHSWQMVSVGKSAMAKKGMLYAAKVMAASAIDALEDPEIVRGAKEELQRRNGRTGL